MDVTKKVAVRHETHEEASAREREREKSSSLFELSLFALQFNLSEH